jgi:formyltetrahydrofolate synthetase
MCKIKDKIKFGQLDEAMLMMVHLMTESNRKIEAIYDNNVKIENKIEKIVTKISEIEEIATDIDKAVKFNHTNCNKCIKESTCKLTALLPKT